jgi:SAM-dependent methyltransferase
MKSYTNLAELPDNALPIFEKISNLFNMEKAEAESSFPSYFIYYHRGFFSSEWNLERHVHYFYDIFQVTEAKGARVLDIGCGFGLLSIFLGTFGAAEVNGIDLDTEKVSGCKSLLKFVDMEDGHVKVELGDALNIGYLNETFDVIIANDVLSHVRELEKFLEELTRLLVPGGRLYVYDDNNKLFLPNLLERRRIWQKCESGPLDNLTMRGTDEKLSYAEMREKMILDLEPDCNPSQLEYLVRQTAGMYGKEIKSALSEFKETGKITNRKRFKYRNPITGEFPERSLNPYTISKSLRRKGFSCLALPTFFFGKLTGFKGNIKKAVWLIFKIIPSLSFIMAPSFRILFLKTKT